MPKIWSIHIPLLSCWKSRLIKTFCFHFPSFSIPPSFKPPFLPLTLPPPLSSPLFVTGWDSFPLLGQLSLNGSCRFCWVQSSRTWAAWHCPPRQAQWHQGGPEPSGYPPSLARPLWRTWTALWLYWNRENQLWEGFRMQSGKVLLKPRWSSY